MLNSFAFAQSKWGIEFKGSRFNCANSGKLEGGSTGFSYYNITEEQDLIAYSQSLGVLYFLNERNILKLHLGRHQIGRILSFESCDDVGNCEYYTDHHEIFKFFQLAPSYTLRFLNKKFLIPIEAGININFTSNEVKTFPVEIHSVNFGYEFSTGLDYRLDPELILGLHFLFTGNINEYRDENIELGTYKPKELGIEFSIIYEFGKSIDNESK